MKISDFTIIFSRVFSGNKRKLQIEVGCRERERKYQKKEKGTLARDCGG